MIYAAGKPFFHLLHGCCNAALAESRDCPVGFLFSASPAAVVAGGLLYGPSGLSKAGPSGLAIFSEKFLHGRGLTTNDNQPKNY